MNSINFDMDGTIADLYGVEGWLDYITNKDTKPYEVAKPLVNLSVLARMLNKRQREGWEINIISWLPKCGNPEYNKRVANAKLQWLQNRMPSVKWDKISIIPYGMPKSSCGNGILFDDEERNRIQWNGMAFNENEIFEILKKL